MNPFTFKVITVREEPTIANLVFVLYLFKNTSLIFSLTAFFCVYLIVGLAHIDFLLIYFFVYSINIFFVVIIEIKYSTLN